MKCNDIVETFSDKRSFKRQELQHELGDESNNVQIVINGKKWKVIPGQGLADSREEAHNLEKMKMWAEKKSAETGKKWSVHLTGASPSIKEMGTAPAGPPQPAKIQKTNPDGTADVVDAKGTVTKVSQKDIVPDSKDPNKLTVNTPKPNVTAGTNVTMTAENNDLDTILRIAGLR